jgi:hypothetical protein
MRGAHAWRMKFAWVLIALALLTAGIASVATPYRHAPARQASFVATEASRLPVALPQRQISGKAKANPFAPRDWAPRAPPAPVRAALEPAPAPSAPPNPYRFAGTLHYGGTLKAVFIREERVHMALPGEMLDGGYKLLSVTRDAVTLLYIPLDTEQRIALAWNPAPDTAIVQAPAALQPR